MPYTEPALEEFWLIRDVQEFADDATQGQFINTYVYKVIATGALGVGLNALANTWAQEILPLLVAIQSEQVKHVRLELSRLIPTQLEAKYEITTGNVGEVASPSMPSTVAVQINRKTVAKGPRGNGKMFVFGVPVGTVVENELTVAYLNDCDSLALALPKSLDSADGWSFHPHLVHYDKANKVWVDSGIVEFTSTNEVTTSLISRRGGRGS